MAKASITNNKRIIQFVIISVLALVITSGIVYLTYKSRQIKLASSPHTVVSPIPSKVFPLGTTTPSLCNCSWAMVGTTNVEFLVTSPSGKQAGYLQATKDYIQEIPDSSYGIEAGIADDTGQSSPSQSFLYFGQNDPENGKYVLQVIPIQSGNYRLDISFAWGPGNTKVSSFDGTLTPNQIDKYAITMPDGIIQKLDK